MEDISKKVVLGLIIATILVSIVGTWAVSSFVDKKITELYSVDKGTGHVSVAILPQGYTVQEQKSEDSGQVRIEIKKPQ